MWWQARPGHPPAPRPRPAPVAVTSPVAVQPQSTQAVVQPKPAPVAVPFSAAPTQAPPPAPVPPPPPAPLPVETTPAPPVIPPLPLEPATHAAFPRPVQDIFEAQLALARLGISAGSLDGLMGPQTRAALRAFQLHKENLPASGELDPATRARLQLAAPPYTNYTITPDDVARLQPLSSTWLGKSRQTALDYETLLELVAEKSHTHPLLIRQLNPAVDWSRLGAGAVVRLPDIAYPDRATKAAFATISLAGKTLEAFDARSNLLVHFPCSIAQRVEKRPVGELRVVAIAPNPNYTFNPDVFPESAEARGLKTRLILPPGPNNPVGVAWISLDRPGYGIHGTPSPEQVGRTESHGCFRLANWNADYLLRLVWVGMPVLVEP